MEQFANNYHHNNKLTVNANVLKNVILGDPNNSFIAGLLLGE
jgi:hypothetical protein